MRPGVRITGPSVTFSRSILASARNPAVSGTSSASKARPVGSRTEACGRSVHIARTETALPVASAAQSEPAACAPGAAQSGRPHEHRSPLPMRLQPGAGEHVPAPLPRVPQRAVQQQRAPLPGDRCGVHDVHDSDGLFHAQHNSRRHPGLRARNGAPRRRAPAYGAHRGM